MALAGVGAAGVGVALREGELVDKRFEDCSVADLKRALGRAGKPERVPREVRDAIAQADEVLDEAVGEDAARRAGVSFRLDRAGDALVDVRGLPFASARAALAALSRAFPSG